MITFDIIEECASLFDKEYQLTLEEEIRTAKAVALIDEMRKFNQKAGFNLVGAHNSTVLVN